jgi:hypothetical protein
MKWNAYAAPFYAIAGCVMVATENLCKWPSAWVVALVCLIALSGYVRQIVYDVGRNSSCWWPEVCASCWFLNPLFHLKVAVTVWK